MCGREITRESDSINFVEGARARDGLEHFMASSLVCGWMVSGAVHTGGALQARGWSVSGDWTATITSWSTRGHTGCAG